MTAKQVYSKIGIGYGKEAFDIILERIRKAHNLKQLGTEESIDDKGKHSNAMVVFGYDNSDEKVDKAYSDFREACLDVLYFLKLFDFGLAFECSGDGDKCILMSYRIV